QGVEKTRIPESLDSRIRFLSSDLHFLAPWLLGFSAPWLLGFLASRLLGFLAPWLLSSSSPFPILFLVFQVILCVLVDTHAVRVGQRLDHLGGYAHDQAARGNLSPGGHQRGGGDDRSFTDFHVVEQGGAHSNQAMRPDRAAVGDHAMTECHPFLNKSW